MAKELARAWSWSWPVLFVLRPASRCAGGHALAIACMISRPVEPDRQLSRHAPSTTPTASTTWPA